MVFSDNSEKKFRLGLILSGFLALAACGLPSTGPNHAEIQAGSVENGGDTHIVYVDDRIADASRLEQRTGFSRAFLNAGNVSVDRINPGDVLSITIWENVDNGLLAGAGQNSTVLPLIQVDQLGNIFVPYAGVIRASGRTAEELRVEITSLLSRQTPDPQVEVRRQAGEGSTVSVVGSVGAQGVYPITASTRRLTAMLATAGGVSLDPSITQIMVQRGNQTGQIWVQDLYDYPENDIRLRADDRIIVREDQRFFTFLGAANSQQRINIESNSFNVVEALAVIGGLSANSSDPSGIFVFRVESPEITNEVLGTNDITTPQRVAYVVDLTSPEGLFIAQDFKIRDQDIVYVTTARFVTWSQILNALSGTVSAIDNIATVASAF